MNPFAYKLTNKKTDYNGEPPIYPDNISAPRRTLMNIEKEGKKWQRFSYIIMTALIGAIGGMIYMGSLPKTVPMVVTVQPWGEAEYVGDVSNYSYKKMPISQVSIEYYLREFVKDIHSISSDEDIVIQNWERAFQFISPRGYKQLEAYFQEKNPFQEIGKSKTYIEIETILKVTESTYQVDWKELRTTVDNTRISLKGKRGVFTIQLAEPDKRINKINPLGIFITEFDIEDKGEL